MTEVPFTVSFGYRNQDDLEKALVNFLSRLGYKVSRTHEEQLRPMEVRERYKVSSPGKLTMQLKRFRGTFPAERSKTGRILTMQVNEELDAYLKKLNS